MAIQLVESVWETDANWGKHAPRPSTIKHVLAVLAAHAREDGTSIFPSIARIARRTSLDRSSVKRVIKLAIERGVLTKVGTRRQVVEYRMSTDLIDSDEANQVHPEPGSQGTRFTQPPVPGSHSPRTGFTQPHVTLMDPSLDPSLKPASPKRKADRTTDEVLDGVAGFLELSAGRSQLHPLASRADHLLALAIPFEEETGVFLAATPAKKNVVAWIRELEAFLQDHCTPEEMRAAARHAVSNKWRIYSPQSIHKALANIRRTPPRTGPQAPSARATSTADVDAQAARVARHRMRPQ